MKKINEDEKINEKKKDEKKPLSKKERKRIKEREKFAKKMESTLFMLYPASFPIKINKNCEIKVKHADDCRKIVKEFLEDLDTIKAMESKFGKFPELPEEVNEDKYYLSFIHNYNAAVISKDMFAGYAIGKTLDGYEAVYRELLKYVTKEKEQKEKLKKQKAATVEHDVMQDLIDRPTVPLDEIPIHTMFICNENVFFKYRKDSASYLLSPLKETGKQEPGLTFKDYLIQYCDFDARNQDILEVRVSPYVPMFITKLDDEISGTKGAICAVDDEDEDDFNETPMISKEVKSKLSDDSEFDDDESDNNLVNN